jgi:hypothetical protein
MTGDNKMAYLYNFQFERYEDGVTYAVEGFAIFNKDDHLEIKSYVEVNADEKVRWDDDEFPESLGDFARAYCISEISDDEVLVMKNRLTKGSRVFGSFPDPRKMLTGGFDFWMYK